MVATMKMARLPMSIKKMTRFTITPSLQRRTTGLVLYTLRYFTKSDMKMPKKSFRKLLQKAERSL